MSFTQNIVVKKSVTPNAIGGLINWLDYGDFVTGQTWFDRKNNYHAVNNSVISSGGFPLLVPASSAYFNLGRVQPLEGDVAYTVCCWCKLFGNSVGNIWTYDVDDTLQGDGSDIYSYWSASSLQVNAGGGSGENGTGISLTDYGWHFFCMVKTVGSASYYDNNVLKLTVGTVGVTPNANFLLRVGFNENVGFWDGYIGEFLIYNKALSVSELDFLFQLQRRSFGI